MPRYFSLLEAESYLPEVERLLGQCRDAKAAYEKAEGELKAFAQRIALTGGMAVSHEHVADPRRRKQASIESLQIAVHRFEEIGCLLKDVDSGLMDFPTLYHDQEVYLCWKSGESGINFWHRVEDGFKGRHPIDAEFLNNHTGS